MLVSSMAFSYGLQAKSPNRVKVVVVTMFEDGQPQGDFPGELQYWVERFPLPEILDFPAGPFPLFSNPRGDVLAICVGGGIANATASIMALGFDPRFDLRHSYWLIAGIAGGDPADTSLGSAVWARHVVDGDLLYEIDAREIPSAWPYGIIPLGGTAPADEPTDIQTGWTLDTIHFALNHKLAGWAYAHSAHLKLKDTPQLAAFRQQFTQHKAARLPPRVQMGDTLSSSTYWHGNLLNGWANDWVALYAGEQANFVTSNMEDSGTLTALERLQRLHKVDMARVMVLRTVSNYTAPPNGKTAAWSTTAPYPNEGEPALDSAYVVGAHIINKILDNWSLYADEVPSL
ncbi:MAG: purine nucleoside permease [Pseudomonadota bacterium]